MAVLLLAAFFGCEHKQANEKKAESGYSKTAVFFIHGAGMAAESWNPLKNFLKNEGYPDVFLRAIQLVPTDGPNIEAAENQIAPAVEKFLSEVNAHLAANDPSVPAKNRVDIVARSMGAVSGRWYASILRPDRVRTWISLAGANHGTDALYPYVGKGGNGADDCHPAFATSPEDSLVQFVLNGLPYVPDVDETPYGIGTDPAGGASIPRDGNKRIFYVTLRTVNDVWIIPDESAILDGAGGLTITIPQDVPAKESPAGNIRLENGVGHDAMLSDLATMKLVKLILEMKSSTLF